MVQRVILQRSEEYAWVQLWAPYNAGFVEALKEMIPSRTGRRPHYSQEGKFDYWLISKPYIPDVIDICNAYFPSVPIEMDTDDPDPAPPSDGDSNPFLKLLEIAPERLQKQIYTRLAQLLHPDVGGDTKLMTLLNNAWRDYDQQHQPRP